MTPVPGFTIVQDLSLEYPKCCARLEKVEKKAKGVSLLEPVLPKKNKLNNRRTEEKIESEQEE